MRLYLDQMFRIELTDILRNGGHDVLRAEDVVQSRADDSAIMTRAIEEGAILVTLDEHFGDWAVLPLDRHPGVIRLKIHPPTTEMLADCLLSFLRRHQPSEFENHLIILRLQRERWIMTTKRQQL